MEDLQWTLQVRLIDTYLRRTVQSGLVKLANQIQPDLSLAGHI